MGKVRDAFEEYIWQKGRRPLFIPLVVIPAAFWLIQNYFGLSFPDTVNDKTFWISSGFVIFISGVLFWFVNRERFRLLLSCALVIGGVLFVVGGFWPPYVRPDKLVVAIANFDSYDGADGAGFAESLRGKLEAIENTPLFVVKTGTVVKNMVSGEAKQLALKLGRSKGAHIILWGTVKKKAGTGEPRVGPRITFCWPIQAVPIDETDVEGFNKTQPDTLVKIDEDEYAGNIASIVAFVSGLAYYKARQWDLAKEAFERTPIGETPIRAAILYQGLCLYQRAQKSSTPEQDLQGAVTLFENVIASRPDQPVDGDDETTRAGCIDRASALATLGRISQISQEEAVERLGKAKDAYGKALECCPRDKAPLDWAVAQSDLGSVLTDLAFSTGDVIGQLEDAIDHYEKALEVYSTVSPKDDSDVAITQTNLGTAYYELAVRLTDDKVEEYLNKAVGAYRAANQIFNRKTFPRRWATISIYAAGALARLALREGVRGDQTASEKHLQQAVDTCTNAASVFKERDDDWAQAKANLAYVRYLQAKGKSGEPGNKLLRAAIEDCRSALTVYEEGGLDWAIANETLGGSSKELGARTPGNAGEVFLQDSIDAYKAALRLRDTLEHNEDWAKVHGSLGSALAELGSRKEGDQRAGLLRDAITNFELALEFYDQPPHRDRYDEARDDLRRRIEAAR